MTALQSSLFPDDRGADFSAGPRPRYRYTLWRIWDRSRPPVAFVMLNPSTADATDDDATIRRCLGFARAWGAGGLHVVNLYAWRATKPRDLDKAGSAAISETDGQVLTNDLAIMAATSRCERVVVAWGAHTGPSSTRAGLVLDLLRAGRRQIVALGLTQAGQPRHPLFVRADARPFPYPPEEAT